MLQYMLRRASADQNVICQLLAIYMHNEIDNITNTLKNNLSCVTTCHI